MENKYQTSMIQSKLSGRQKYTIGSAMKFLFLAVLVLSSLPSYSQDLQTILKAHFIAVKSENLQSIRSLLMEVKEVHDDGGIENYSIIKKRPHKIRIEGMRNDLVYVKAFDGLRAWTIAPWTGTSTPQLMTESERADIISIDRIDSPLLIAESVSESIKYIGELPLNGEMHFGIEVRLPGRPVMQYLLDKKEHLIRKSLRYAIHDESSLVEEVFYKRYNVEGAIVLPLEYEIRRKGKSVDLVIMETIIGQGASSSLFKKPE